MNPELPIILTPASKQDWLQMRTNDITGTEAAALYGLSPYMTLFELWHLKKAQQIQEIDDNERMRWGRRLEPIIAAGIAEDFGLEIEPMAGKYFRLPSLRAGATLDFHFRDKVTGQHGPLEIKNVDWFVHNAQWMGKGDDAEAPAHIEIQVQHQLMVTGDPFAKIAPLVGGNAPKLITRARDEDFIGVHREKITAFWKSIEDNVEPEADFTRDAEFIAKVLCAKASEGVTLDIATLPEADQQWFRETIVQYKDRRDTIGNLQDESDALKAQMLTRIGDASKVLIDKYTISSGNVAETPPTVITPEMVGQTYGGRRGFRNFRVTKKKGE